MLSVLIEFLAVLWKVLWYSAVGFVKLFLPVQNKDVSKEVVLITGAGSGIGRLMALRFADLGAKVVLWDINKQGNDAVAQEITAKSQAAFAYQCDCSKREDIYRTAAKVKEDVGEVTVLINNAGIVSGKKFFDVSDDMADLTFKVNTAAHFWTIKAFVPEMMKKNKGHIITIASGAGLFGVAGLMDYCASKFGAVGIHEALTSELSNLKLDGVHTTCVCPFYISTGMFEGVKTRFSWLLPIVSPEYAVKKILQAFHGNQNYLIMPRLVVLFLILKPILPVPALLEAGRFLGVNSSMDTFVGRKKKE